MTAVRTLVAAAIALLTLVAPNVHAATQTTAPSRDAILGTWRAQSPDQNTNMVMTFNDDGRCEVLIYGYNNYNPDVEIRLKGSFSYVDGVLTVRAGGEVMEENVLVADGNRLVTSSGTTNTTWHRINR